jgi:hypothetical protein
MKMGSVIIVIAIAFGLLFFIKSHARSTSSVQNYENLKDNYYSDLRNMALNVTRQQLEIKESPGDYKVFGIVMDWGLDNGTATLVAFLSGDASLYFSSGGGVVGGIVKEKVKLSALNFIRKAQDYFDMTSQTNSSPLPINNEVKFYFLTDEGRFVATEEIQNIKNHSSNWYGLFNEANKVIDEIRLLTPDK